jgi:hypothetical protein
LTKRVLSPPATAVGRHGNDQHNEEGPPVPHALLILLAAAAHGTAVGEIIGGT